SMPVSRSAMQASDASVRNRLLSSGSSHAERASQNLDVLFRLYPAKNCRNTPVAINDERAALSAHVFFPIHAFLHPNAIRVNNFFVGIGQEGKGQLIFLDKLFVACWRINAHAEDFRARTQFAPGIAHATRLDGASRRIVFRIKIENDRGSAKIRDADFLAGAEITTNRDRAKIWCLIANF